MIRRTLICLLMSAFAIAANAQGTAAPPTDPLPNSAATTDADAAAPVENTFEPEPDPAEVIGKLFQDPPGAVRLSKEGRLWVDKQGKQVIVDGYVAMNRGMLEMFACPAGTKEHESVVGVLARSRDVHTALLAIGAQKGTPVQFVPNFVSATGQAIRIWVMWFDETGKLHKADAKTWVVKTGTKKPLAEEWVFGGSNFWTDPSDGVTYYEADSGDLICVSNFSSAMMDLPVASSKDTNNLQFSAAEGVVPEERTPVRLIMVPIPLPADNPEPRAPEVADPNQPPADKWLVRRNPATPAEPKKSTPKNDPSSAIETTPANDEPQR